jgi:hypothetical protein
MLKYHSQNEDPRTTAKRLEELRGSLRARLFKQVSQEELESCVLEYLNQLGDRLPVKQILARRLAQYFRQNWSPINARALEELIQRRPENLHDVLQSIDSEDHDSLSKIILALPRTKPKRIKPADETQRQRNRRRAKNRYDYGRGYRRRGAGLIEREFGERRSELFLSLLPGGPCLDELFRGGEVKMAGDLYCLQDLFGMDRHKIPKNLPFVPRGRQRNYNLHSVLECMRQALADTRRGHQWLPDPKKRQIVLAGIIARAEAVAPQRVQTAVMDALMPFVV